MLNRKLQNFYDLANLERSEIRDVHSSNVEHNAIQRMIINNEREREIDVEERFQFRRLPVYEKNTNNNYRNHFSNNELDTILYQYHTSSENRNQAQSRMSIDSKPRIDFSFPNQAIDEKNLQSISNTQDEKHPSSLIMVDVFQRFRDQPKVTRELPNLQEAVSPTQKQKKKKIDPSKNRRKIDETIQSTFIDKDKDLSTSKDPEKVLNQGEVYTKRLINKGIVYSKTNTGAFVLIPNLPSFQRRNHMKDNFMD